MNLVRILLHEGVDIIAGKIQLISDYTSKITVMFNTFLVPNLFNLKLQLHVS